MTTSRIPIAPLQARDIVRAADLMIGRYGHGAGARVARRVLCLERQGERTAAVIWSQVLEAVEAAQQTGRAPPIGALGPQAWSTHRQ